MASNEHKKPIHLLVDGVRLVAYFMGPFLISFATVVVCISILGTPSWSPAAISVGLAIATWLYLIMTYDEGRVRIVFDLRRKIHYWIWFIAALAYLPSGLLLMWEHYYVYGGAIGGYALLGFSSVLVGFLFLVVGFVTMVRHWASRKHMQ